MSTVTRLNGLTRDPVPQPTTGAKKILVLNLMPNRAVTEQQFASIFAATGFPVTLTFCLPASHQIRQHTDQLHAAYATFPEIEDQFFDGLIITGAPLDQKPFTDVDYWDELQEILTWRRTHVQGSLFLCWGAYAAGAVDGVFVGHGIPEKITGVFTVEGYTMPQSRYFLVPLAAIERGEIVAGNLDLGAVIVTDDTTQSTYVAGHFEYSANTLALEYYRDQAKNGDAAPEPQHYFTGDNQYSWTWRADAVAFYRRWLAKITDSQPPAAADTGTALPTIPLTSLAAARRAGLTPWQGANVDTLIYNLTPHTDRVWLLDTPAHHVDLANAWAILHHIQPDIQVIATKEGIV
jgi:homoserine O-succinyltransferase